MLCKLREWVWTETGKGDRLGGRQSGRSEHAFQVASTTALPPQTSLNETRGRPASPAGLFRPCLAMPCLPASALTPCLLALVFCSYPVPSITMCNRITQVARTALQAAAHGDCIGAARAPFCVCLRPFHPAHVKGEAWDCIGQPATFLCSFRHLLHEPETAFGQPGSLLQEWPVGWHMACRVRVSCRQQLKT